MLIYSSAAIAIGFILDLLLGDPHNFPHIIRMIGWLIARLECALRKALPHTPRGERAGGVLLVLFVALICTGVPFALLFFAYSASPWFGMAIESLICYQLLATKNLKDESMKVYLSLVRGDLMQARSDVSMIVGRDTDELDEAGITRAAVETVAENTADGCIAPMLYIMLGGAALGCLYKAVNTMDSMVGYKNERYIDFGRCAAKLDDALNFFPARIAAMLMIFGAALCGLDAGNALRIYRRDRKKHASPNSAHTEAVTAGALNVQLAGNAHYFGKLHEKPTIGDALRPIEPVDIRRVHKLMYTASILSLLLALLVRGCLYAAL